MAVIHRHWAFLSPSNRTVIAHSNINVTEIDSEAFADAPLPREGRITRARNVALEALKQSKRTKYVIVIDLDILGWDPQGVVDAFGHSAPWDVMCSHGILLHGIYRDTYAFRAPGINTNHHWCGQDYAKYNMTKADQMINRELLTVGGSYQSTFYHTCRLG